MNKNKKKKKTKKNRQYLTSIKEFNAIIAINFKKIVKNKKIRKKEKEVPNDYRFMVIKKIMTYTAVGSAKYGQLIAK